MHIVTVFFTALLLGLSQVAHSNSIDTIYNYHNRTAYIHLKQENIIIPLSFNSKYTNGDLITTTIEPPSVDSKIISADNNVYAIYSNDNNNTIISTYNDTQNSWTELQLENQLEFFESSGYLNTFDDPTTLYVYGGLNSTSNQASNRLVKIDLDSLEVDEVDTSIQPTPFYDFSSVLINYNTQLFIGGKASSGWVGMKQLALWQYQSWGFKTAVFGSNSTSISSRIDPLILPIFDTALNQDYANNNFTDFSVSSLFMIGGELSEGSYSSPNFAYLDMSTSTWSWESLDTNISLANSKVNSNANCELDLNKILGAAMIYDTLVVISNTTAAGVTSDDTKKSKRSSQEYFIKLFNTTSLETIDSIDYTSFDTSSTKSKSNKSLIIVLSVIIPVLAIIILTIVFVLLYKRHKRKKQDEENEKEIQDIMEFYQGAHNHSASTLTSSTISQKSPEKTTTIHHENSYFGNEVKINDYDDGDNLSISSWRRKREEYAREQRKHISFIPAIPMNKVNNQTVISDPGDEAPRTSGSIVKRSLSSLRRNLSLQSSIRSFVTAKSTFQEDEEEILQDLVEPLSPPPKVYSSDSPKSNSSLYLIPEHESPSPPYMKSPKLEARSIMSSASNTNSSSTNYSNDTLNSKSVNGSRYSHTHDSSLIFQNITPNLSPPMKAASRFSPKVQHQQLPPLNTNPFVVGHADDEDLDNLDVQVLVSSKRRSKLRIINPDEENPFEEVDMEKDLQSPALRSSPLPKQSPGLQFSPIPKQKSNGSESDDQEGLFDTSMVDGLASPKVPSGARKRCVSDENKNKDESAYL